MRILGIDPGYAIVGFGAVRYERGRFAPLGYGAVTTRAHTEFTSRLEEIYDGMTELIAKYRPDCISVEKLYFNTNTTTAIAVAEARGCILLAAKKGLVPVYEYTPLQGAANATLGKVPNAKVDCKRCLLFMVCLLLQARILC